MSTKISDPAGSESAIAAYVDGLDGAERKVLMKHIAQGWPEVVEAGVELVAQWRAESAELRRKASAGASTTGAVGAAPNSAAGETSGRARSPDRTASHVRLQVLEEVVYGQAGVL